MFDFLSNKFSSIFSKITGKSHLTEGDIAQMLEQTRQALLEADVPFEIVQTFCDQVKNEVVGQKAVATLKPSQQVVKVFHDRLKEFLGGQNTVPLSFQIPSVIMVMGLQGSGKTTSIAKMAYLVKKEAQERSKDRRILVASVDFYRPAAVDQLEILAGQAHVSFYRATSTDPVKAAQEIYAYFQKGQFELLFLDTAGRLHIDNELLQELRSIDASLRPKYKILVLDAMTGQESLAVAQAFDQAVGFENAMLTKMDSETRAGAAFAFRYALKKPIVFAGIGEKIQDIERLHPERLAGRILGMGDMVTLAERAQEQIKESEQENLQKAWSKGQLTLQDFADQMKMMNKLGSLSQVMKYMPGAGGQITPEMLEKGEQELKKFNAIIQSMTAKERSVAKILDGSRKKRIAEGAGVTVADVNMLLERFEQSQQYAKLLKKLGRGLFK